MKSILLKASVAMLAVATLAFSTQAGDDLTWYGDSGNYSAPANWTSDGDLTGYTSIFDWKTDAPGKNIRFGGAAASKTVTMDIWDNRVWNCWFYNGATPVTFAAADTTTGFEAYWGFHLSQAGGDISSLTIQNGLYTTPAGNTGDNASSWATGDNAKATLNLAGGKLDLWGATGNDGLYISHGKGITNIINITGGELAVANDVSIGNADTDDTTYTEINISNGGRMSCGTATTPKWFKFPNAGTGTTKITLGANGTLALWHLRHGAAGQSTLNFDGGTLEALGDIGYGLVGYETGTDASTFPIVLQANGGTIKSDFDTALNNPVSGMGSLVKKGAGTLTFDVMPVFTGTITVEEGAGAVILPAGATIAAGTGTAKRTLADDRVEYFYGSVVNSSTRFTVGEDATITLAGKMYLEIDEDAAIGALSVAGAGTLYISGDSTVTATSLDIASGVTVRLASASTLATGALRTAAVTGSGTIVYDSVPDGTMSDLKPDEAGYTLNTWTGTVWIQNCIYRTATGNLWTNPAAYGNANSTVKFTNASIYLPAGVDCQTTVELSDVDSDGVTRTFALSLTNGSGNQVNRFAKLTGDGTLTAAGAGGTAEVLSIVDISGFAGTFNMPSRIVVIGDTAGTIASNYTSFGTTGVMVIPEDVTVSVPAAKTWILQNGYAGAGTLKYTNPWQVGEKSLCTNSYWKGVVELAACVNATSSAVVVYPQRMGNANSTVVFKGLGPKDGDATSYASYWIDTKTIDTTIRLDGDVTLYGNGYSGSGNSTTITRLTGTGNFTLLTALSDVTYYDVTLEDYTGTLAAKPGQDCIRVAAVCDSKPATGTKLASVDATNNNVQSLGYVLVDGEEYPLNATVQEVNGEWGLYTTSVQRDVYWVGGASGNWSDTTAWALADGTPFNSYPQDGTQNAGDNVVFTNAAVVAIDVRPVITKMTLNADVTISTADAFQDNTYSGMKYLFVETIVGPGVLTMSNAVLAGHSSSRPFKIYSPVCIAEGTSNAFGCSTYVNYLYGNLSGSGYIKVGNGNWGGLSLQGDNSAFSGQFESTQGGTRNASNFSGAQASSALASWTISAQSQNGVNTSTYLTDNSTYYFGALNGYLQLGEKSGAPILEIGARDEDCECQLVGRHDDGKSIYRRYSITKVGNAKFTIKEASTQPGTIDIQSGTVVFPDDIAMAFYTSIKFSGAGAQLTYNGVADLSGYIANSSSAIVIDTDANATWATALAASNVGGLTKKGTGTLTLTAVPQYGGQTVVEAGELVVPAGTQLESLSGSGKLVVDLANTDATGVLFALGNIADGASYEVRNEPAALNTVRTDKGVTYYVGEPKTYVWVGPSGDDYNWSTLSNWSVNDATPMEPPTAIDIVQFSPDASVVVDAAATALSITAGGALTVTANYDLAVTGDIAVNGVLTKWGMASVSANGAITADSVAIGTGAVVALSGSDPTSLTLDVGSTSAYAIDDAASSNGYGAKYSVLGDGTLVLSGHGQVNAAGNQTVHVAEANTTNSFTGFLCGSMSLAKTGAGTLALFGNNTFTGDVAIEAGSIKLNTPLDLGDVRCDFDASNAGITYSANVLRWQDAAQPNNANAFLWTDTASGTNPDFVENGAIFNGKKVLYSDSFRMVEPNVSPHNSSFPKTTFFVMQNTEGGTQVIAGDNNDTMSPTRWSVAWRNYGYMTRFGNDGSSSWNSNAIWANGILAIQNNNPGQRENGGASFGSNPVVLTIVRNFSGNNEGWMDSRYVAHRAFIGGSGKQAWAEYLSYTRELSFDEKAAVEQYLMAKWGIAGEYTALPKTANVTMKAGTTLDMGGLTQTVKSFAGAGTVVNGSLKTTGSLKVTGALTIPAVKGQMYELGAANLTLTAGEKGAIVKVPDDAKALGRLIVPHGWTVGTDPICAVVVENLPKNWDVRRQREGDETDQWFIGPNAFVIHFR